MHTTSFSNPRLRQLERRLSEAFDSLWDSFVDPAEALVDADGLRWQPLCAGGGGGAAGPLSDEAHLADIRAQCRALALENEFAINAHEKHLSQYPKRHPDR